ncbi:MAG: PKD domain-containing protein [Bacteroidota bacterium]
MFEGFCQQADSIPARVFSPEDSSRIKVRRLDINSIYSDFSPVLYKNIMFFVSGRPGKLAVSYANENNTEITDLYSSGKHDSVSFSKGKALSKNINTKFNESSLTISNDGNLMYLTGNARPAKGSTQAPAKLQIYQSKKVNSEWTVPEASAFCDPEYSNCHPAFSADNKMLVFCSDMPGGFGGTDLYFTKFENNSWTQPVNFGAKVNSAANELFPYIYANTQLYFSCKRSGGPGGLDIYLFDLNDPNGETSLLSHPINSAFDDFGLCLDSAGKTGYFSSNRKVGTSDDIYFFSEAYPDFSKSPSPPVKEKFCYSFFEENGYKSNDSVTMIYEWDFGDGQKVREDKCKHCFSAPGNYLVRLNVVEKSSGEVFFNQVSYTLTVEAPPKLFINCSDTVTAGTEIMIDAEKSGIKGYGLTTFYWSFGDGKYNTGVFVKHRYKKPGTYKLELGVMAKNEQTLKMEKFKIEKSILVKDTM